MMHAKSESDVTSLDQSSPGSSSPQKRLAYYVQSPSRDSHYGGDGEADCDKSSSSIHASATTPVYNDSPTDSPSHPSAYARHSLTSSASRFSGTFRTKGSRRSSNDRPWPHCSVIQEEGAYDQLHGSSSSSIRFPRRCQCLIALLGLAGVFAMFCLVIWGASRPYRVQISVESLTVNNFYFGEGSDLTGVPTKFLTINCSVKMKVHNPATFFGIHVSSAPIKLLYSEMTVATGQLMKYYQPRKSHRTVFVKLEGNMVPLYGAGAGLATSEINGGVPLLLLLNLRSRGDVVGTLVRSEHRRRVSCDLTINSRNTLTVKFKTGSCIYE